MISAAGQRREGGLGRKTIGERNEQTEEQSAHSLGHTSSYTGVSRRFRSGVDRVANQ